MLIGGHHMDTKLPILHWCLFMFQCSIFLLVLWALVYGPVNPHSLLHWPDHTFFRYSLSTGKWERCWCPPLPWRIMDHWIQHQANEGYFTATRALFSMRGTRCYCWLLEAFSFNRVSRLVGHHPRIIFWWPWPECSIFSGGDTFLMSHNVCSNCWEMGRGCVAIPWRQVTILSCKGG